MMTILFMACMTLYSFGAGVTNRCLRQSEWGPKNDSFEMLMACLFWPITLAGYMCIRPLVTAFKLGNGSTIPEAKQITAASYCTFQDDYGVCCQRSRGHFGPHLDGGGDVIKVQ